ncbi:MAG: 4Fe-4S binding protein [Peptococcaceae bacterium]|nr:4Fe-4S binding protein [Candidatus Syntrophopropionicum ammoniitolerans]
MRRTIIKIDEEKCTGCGLCVDACDEGALKMIDGKAKLISESYCDGLGACLPECPAGAITIEERDADPFDEEAVKKHLENLKASPPQTLACGCPGTAACTFERKEEAALTMPGQLVPQASQLRQWPCQIKLVPVNAPYFADAHLLVAADCTAYAYANVHSDFMRNKITIIGCPKLDDIDYGEKLTAILKSHDIKSLTVLRMEVPCCGGIVNGVKQALMASGKMIPWHVITVSTDGNIVED